MNNNNIQKYLKIFHDKKKNNEILCLECDSPEMAVTACIRQCKILKTFPLQDCSGVYNSLNYKINITSLQRGRSVHQSISNWPLKTVHMHKYTHTAHTHTLSPPLMTLTHTYTVTHNSYTHTNTKHTIHKYTRTGTSKFIMDTWRHKSIQKSTTLKTELQTSFTFRDSKKQENS